jgi:parvulin-like peptidyl-prolyl isomerase
MAKKRQTTGLPKQRQPQQPEETPVEGTTPATLPTPTIKPSAAASRRDERSRREQEQEKLRNILFWAGVVLIGLFVVIAVAFVNDQFFKPRQTVATVNGQNITIADFQKRVRIERALINEEISANVSPLINFGLITDPNDAINQLYQFDANFRQLVDDLGTSDRLGLRVLNGMIDDVIIQQQAEAYNFEITEAEIDDAVLRFLQVGAYDPFDPQVPVTGDSEGDQEGEETDAEATEEPTSTPTPLVSPTPTTAPTQTPVPEVEPTATLTPFPSATPTNVPTTEEIQADIDKIVNDFYRNAGGDAGVSRNDIREIFRLQVLREKLAHEVLEIPEVSIWVDSRHILVNEEETAKDIIAALNEGESFAAIARVSSEDGSGANGGELGWVNSFNYVDGFREAVRELEVGVISAEPVQTSFGWHVIQVREREEREIEDSEIQSIIENEFGTWLTDFRAQPENEIKTSNSWPDNVPTEPRFNLRIR